MSKHKAAFVNIIGNPNTGKSTLMNRFVGEKLSIITSKSQTTRHSIKGIVNTDEYQLVFTDTPGVLKPHYKLQESMLKYSETALTDADIILYVTDIFESIEKNEEFLQKVKKVKAPVLLVINKIDLSKP
jgi:GTP-binding protein Era